MQNATIGSSVQSVGNTSFAATVGNTTQGVIVNKVLNNFSNLSQVEFTLTADSTAANVSDIYLLPGTGVGAVAALPTGVTVSGDYNAWAAWCEYVRNNDLYISKIWMQSADTSNYDFRMTTGLIMPNGRRPFDTYKQLSDYKKSTGAGDAKEISIEDFPFVTKPNMFLIISLKKNTSIRIILTIPAMNATADVAEVKY